MGYMPICFGISHEVRYTARNFFNGMGVSLALGFFFRRNAYPGVLGTDLEKQLEEAKKNASGAKK